ncbi:hypothetical protein [Campylobacter jejuni]|uniref:hypothetical protein n=1 Tax=Campylobacter jejuni TaxID=197 RepID=UPI00207BB68D|nr:hypothetical protein [Campylobacter jejuni]
MDNKQQINKLRDMAELAQASYGYFHYVDNKFDIKDEDKIVTFENVLDITYKNSKIIDERGLKSASSMATSPHSKLNNSFLAMIC